MRWEVFSKLFAMCGLLDIISLFHPSDFAMLENYYELFSGEELQTSILIITYFTSNFFYNFLSWSD